MEQPTPPEPLIVDVDQGKLTSLARASRVRWAVGLAALAVVPMLGVVTSTVAAIAWAALASVVIARIAWSEWSLHRWRGIGQVLAVDHGGLHITGPLGEWALPWPTVGAVRVVRDRGVTFVRIDLAHPAARDGDGLRTTVPPLGRWWVARRGLRLAPSMLTSPAPEIVVAVRAHAPATIHVHG